MNINFNIKLSIFTKKLDNFFSTQKKKFLMNAIYVWISTQLSLQIFLIFFPIAIATLISQIIYIFLGYSLYSQKVFKIKIYKKYTPLKFIIFSIILWLINSTGIYFINIFIDNKNISAILVIPFIALISYTIQKKYIFN